MTKEDAMEQYVNKMKIVDPSLTYSKTSNRYSQYLLSTFGFIFNRYIVSDDIVFTEFNWE